MSKLKIRIKSKKVDKSANKSDEEKQKIFYDFLKVEIKKNNLGGFYVTKIL